MIRTPIVGLAGVLLLSTASEQAKPGRLDPAFGHGGMVTTQIELWAQARAIAVQRDGKIVLAGWSAQEPSFGPFRWAFARYNRNGTLDRRFGRRGKVSLDLGDGYGAYGVALQRDGKIVAAGHVLYRGRDAFELVRLRRNGSLDPGFGRKGVVVTAFPFGAIASSVAIQPDGNIVAAGSAGQHFAVARYLPDGSLDTNFGSGGTVTTQFASAAGGEALALQPDTDIVVAGFLGHDYEGFALARYLPDGIPDSTFGGDGRVVTHIGAESAAFALAVQRDGKIVAGGLARDDPSPFDHFALARYSKNGHLDPRFGDLGVVRTRVSRDDYISSLAIGRDGKIDAAGVSWQNNYGFALARYKPNGALDQSFGHHGERQTQIGGLEDLANAVALQRDGKVLLAGMANTRVSNGGEFASRDEFALVRYLGSKGRRRRR